MRLAFVVADVAAQQPSYATAHLTLAALRRGHDAGLCGIDDLTLLPTNAVSAVVVRPGRAVQSTADLCAALAAEGRTATEEVLSSYDVVFLRYNPHREARFGGNPAIDFGWRLRHGGVVVVNDPEGTQKAGGRMYLSTLPAEVRPRSLITRDAAKLKAFLKQLDTPAVLRPLHAREEEDTSFYVARGQVKNLNQIITVLRKTGYVLAQEFVPDASIGEKRLLLLGGDPVAVDGRVAVYRRMGPDESSADPTTRRRCDFAPEDSRIVDLLRPKLAADGLYLVGIDIVGGKVLEVNVFTPGGMQANLELYGIDVADAVIRDLERRTVDRDHYSGSVTR